jgi:hypothetical protein
VAAQKKITGIGVCVYVCVFGVCVCVCVCKCVYVLKQSKSYKFTLIYITADNMREFINKSDLYLTWKIKKFHIWNTALYGAETWTLRK